MADEISRETLRTGISDESSHHESLSTLLPTFDSKALPPPRVPPPILPTPTAAPRTLSLASKMSTPIPSSHRDLDYENPLYFCKTTQPHFCFTPFSQSSFQLDNLFWKTLEHYVQAQKFIGHPTKIIEIIAIPKPEQVAHYTNNPENSRFINDIWNKEKRRHMYRGLYAKMVQNEDIFKELMHTGNRYLIYETDDDKTWGIGADKSGKNYLGLLLCHIRLYFRSHPSPHEQIPSPKFTFDFMELPEHRLPVPNFVPIAMFPSDLYPLTKPLVEGDTIAFGGQDAPYYEFSNYSFHGFKLDGFSWPTLNHFYQAQKFQDYPRMQKEISELTSPDIAWSYARDHSEYISRGFDGRKDSVVLRGLEAKFSQNNDLLKLLIETDGKKLVYSCADDAYWGMGMENRGINRLGNLLSDIRIKLKDKYPKSLAHYSTIGMPTMFSPVPNDIYFFDPKKEYYEFTPTSQHPVFLNGKSWPTVSHYFHCQKYKDRPDIMGQIESSSGVDKAWAIAHDAKNMQFMCKNWDEIRDRIMSEAFEAKFGQHQDVLTKLKETDSRRLLFAAENEHWGIGKDKKGENKIGKILTEIRRKYIPLKSRSMMTPSASPAPIQLINNPIKKDKKHDENAIYFFEKTSSHYPLTSFSPYPFYMDGKQWPTVNHYFQAQKFQSHPNIQEMIRQAETPFLALELAQDSNEYLISDWAERRNEVMRLALNVRFDQHSQLKDMLLKTFNETLVFNNQKDSYWGIGDGTGKNRFGKILMQLRESYCTPKRVNPSYFQDTIPDNVMVKPSHYTVDKDKQVILAKNKKDEVIGQIRDSSIKYPISVCDDEECLYVLCAPTLVKFNKHDGRIVSDVSLTIELNKVEFCEGRLRILDLSDGVKNVFTTDLNSQF